MTNPKAQVLVYYNWDCLQLESFVNNDKIDQKLMRYSIISKKQHKSRLMKGIDLKQNILMRQWEV